MSNILLINRCFEETRVALLENGGVAEFYVERGKDHSLVGNIYKGKVTRILPGMQAAFVDIGLERAAFLYVTDVQDDLETLYLSEEAEGEPFAEDSGANGEETPERPAARQPHAQIQDLLTDGQEIIVQVAKAPMGTKGARVTSHISLPGRNIVFIPSLGHIGISRRITQEAERDRLRKIVGSLKPEEAGFIVRTACEGKSEQDIREDMDYLLTLWKEIRQEHEKLKAPALLHQDLDLSLRVARDLFTTQIDRLIIDDPEEHTRVKNFVGTFLPKLKDSLELYQGNETLFDAFNIEADIERALGRKVWLKSGGYIIIDQMEALTAIDVNTGRFVGKRNLEDTILKTNLEAVREIAMQLRLRNLGGIIIIDFIDMLKRANRERVFNALQEALKSDRAKTNVLKISEIGLVEMTRKRTQESLVRYLCEPCPYCEGKAYVKSAQTVCFEVLRNVRREFAGGKTGRNRVLNVHPQVANLLADEERKAIDHLEQQNHCKISIKAKPDFHLEQYEIIEK